MEVPLVAGIAKQSTTEPPHLLKQGQNKKGQKIFQLHRFLNTFYSWQLRKSIQKTVQLEIFLALLILWRL